MKITLLTAGSRGDVQPFIALAIELKSWIRMLLLLQAKTSSALRAGVPMIVVPDGNNQFAWAKRTYELGVGTKPIKLKDLTVQTVFAAFERVKSQDLKDKAAEIGERIHQEKGANHAAKRFLELVSL